MHSVNQGRYLLEQKQIDLELKQFLMAIDNSSAQVAPSSSLNPHPRSHLHMNNDIEIGGFNHTSMMTQELKPDSEVFAGLKEPMSWEHEQELIEHELEGFGEYIEEVFRYRQPEMEEEDLTVPAALVSELHSLGTAILMKNILAVSAENYLKYQPMQIGIRKNQKRYVDLFDNLPSPSQAFSETYGNDTLDYGANWGS
ncbi:hypothetical protein K439DRAFT_1618423 [Ramaria rubella]|nr:hypothetical protein K439DRAFT_1618423 [Ramaria rubella]